MLCTFVTLIYATTCGCAFKEHDKGLLTVQERKVSLTNIDGQRFSVFAGRDQQYLANLSGCIVSLYGARLFQNIFVHDWMVHDAGSGSAPFLGPIQREGIQWVIQDHNTKSMIYLENISEFLIPEGNRVVIVGGYIVGPQRLRVVSARYIDGKK